MSKANQPDPPNPSEAQLQAAVEKAANRLHHLSMKYVGHLLEASTGKTVGLIASGAPGVRECRDLIDQVLYCRAEVNGLMQFMVDAGIVTRERYLAVMAEQYEWFAQVKAKQMGVIVTDHGLTFPNPSTQN